MSGDHLSNIFIVNDYGAQGETELNLLMQIRVRNYTFVGSFARVGDL